MEPKPEVFKELNDLYSKHIDAMNGFGKVAEKTESDYLKGIFTDYRDMHMTMGKQLNDELMAIGGYVDKGGSMEGKIHQDWIDVKTFFASEKDEVILEECIRGQKVCLKECREALELEGLPASTRTLLQNQSAVIERTINTLHAEEEARS